MFFGKAKYCIDGDWQVERPFRSSLRGTAAISLLFCVVTPFVNDIPNRWLFLFGGFGYSAFLSFFATGIGLLPRVLRALVSYSLFAYQGCCLAISVGIMLAARAQRLDLIKLCLTPLIWITGTISFGFFALSIYGWFSRIRHGQPREV